jgi:precorrin-6A/cobalt-precorrin-6A reductase
MRILILGGTTEARQLATRLARRGEFDVTASLAGRTSMPVAQPVPVRTGGFGGAAGLAAHLDAEGIDVLVDATHPYAAMISANAARAAAIARVRLLALRRPAWLPVAGDCWIEVANAEAAVQALEGRPHRVFLALGRGDIGAFERAPQHFYLVRSVEPLDPPLRIPHAVYVVARGPFSEADDRGLLSTHCIDTVVAKNSGGAATYGKIAAARSLGLPVLLLQRPAPPDEVPAVASVDGAVAWLDHELALRRARASNHSADRGV